MPDLAGSEGQRETPSPARVEAFSDGVFAIIITLLVLDLHVPRRDELDNHSLAAVLLEQWPLYLSYALSFLQVGVVWINHHTMFHYIQRSDHVLLFHNLMLLLCTALVPFTTAIFAEYRPGNAIRYPGCSIYLQCRAWRCWHFLQPCMAACFACAPGQFPCRRKSFACTFLALDVRACLLRGRFCADIRQSLLERGDLRSIVVLLCASWTFDNSLDDRSAGTENEGSPGKSAACLSTDR